jgi:hypothetical protein
VASSSVCDGGAGPACGTVVPAACPRPTTTSRTSTGPEVGSIVKFHADTNRWEDSIGRDWGSGHADRAADLDVFALDAAALVPAETASFAHVGTVPVQHGHQPVNGKVYVSNTEARNEVRFEGRASRSAARRCRVTCTRRASR